MVLINKKLCFVLLSIVLLSFNTMQLPEKLLKKVNAAIVSSYETESFSLSGVSSTDISQKDHLFKILKADELMGYAYVGEADSMKNVFDYIILFTPDLNIKKTKVLIYREEHGRQIGAQRWLKQFIGMSTNKKPIYGENIDAISGATISAKSMTTAIKDALQTMDTLKNKNII